MISNHLTNKNYNVNDAQIWTNQICDDVLKETSRSSKILQLSIETSSSSPIVSSCKRLIVDSISQVHASGIMKSMGLSPSSGMLLRSFASLTSLDAPFDPHYHYHHIFSRFIKRICFISPFARVYKISKSIFLLVVIRIRKGRLLFP